MKPTRIERLILANQYRILDQLFPDYHYGSKIKALEYGYELDIDELLSGIDDPGMSLAECEQVIDVLAMYDDMQFHYSKMSEKPDIEESRLHFPGFDGNHETKYMIYARYFCEEKDAMPRFDGLKFARDRFNSHAPMMHRYRDQLAVWNQCDKLNLTPDDIVRIVEAAYPSVPR